MSQTTIRRSPMVVAVLRCCTAERRCRPPLGSGSGTHLVSDGVRSSAVSILENAETTPGRIGQTWAIDKEPAELAVRRRRDVGSSAQVVEYLGPKVAARVVGHFGVDTLRVIEE